MRMPESLSSLVDEGIIEEVLRPLMSGKEAQIYLVVAGGRECVAKIYKEAQNRTFKHRADYTEGRKVRNSRDQRAIDRRSKHGRGQDEAAWRSTEVDMIYRLQAAGVRVPAPYHFIDGVLVMELVTDANGEPAPRIGEVRFSPEQATAIYETLIREVVRMLCAGVVHGDLSDFNVLLGQDGPVIIDLPQAIDPSKNQNARKLLLRDVENLHRFYSRFVPSARRLPFAEEMWALYESNQLTPETVLRGQYRPSQKKADTNALLELIGEVNEDERRRRGATEPARGGAGSGAGPRPRRIEFVVDKSHVRGGKPQPARGRPNAPTPGRPAPHAATGRPAPPPRGAEPSSPRQSGSERGTRERLAVAGLRDRPLPARGPEAHTEPARAAPAARRRRRRKPRPGGAAPHVAHSASSGSNEAARPAQARQPPALSRVQPGAGRNGHEAPRHSSDERPHRARPDHPSLPSQDQPRSRARGPRPSLEKS